MHRASNMQLQAPAAKPRGGRPSLRRLTRGAARGAVLIDDLRLRRRVRGCSCIKSDISWPCARRCTLAPFGAKDRKSTRLNSSHTVISYAVFCLKKKKKKKQNTRV